MTIDFLKYSIRYLENQIKLIDQKSGFLIGGLGIFYIALTIMVSHLFLQSALLYINIFGFIALIGIFVLTVMCILSLQRSYTEANEQDNLERLSLIDDFMWYSEKFPGTGDDYKNRIKTMDDFSIKKCYMQSHYVLLQLIRDKYRYYHGALDKVKLMFVMSLYSVAFLFLLRVVSLIIAFFQRDVLAI